MTKLSSRFHSRAISTLQFVTVTLTEISETKTDPPGQERAPIWIPAILLVLVSLVARACDLDRGWQREFWSPNSGWPWAGSFLVQFLYHYGTWPAIIAAGAGASAWIISKVTGKWQRLSQPGLFLALLLALGPGLVVNAIFKDHFRRPRPTQTEEFGGSQSFRPVGEPGGADEGKSFPSGHASMGFYWLGLFIYFWNRNRGLAWAFGGLGLLHGLVMGVGRMAQGGHWFTDVLWSAGFVYLTGWVLHYLLFCRQTIAQQSTNAESQQSS
jgi:membrane-associated PAP2 superfamily phosphatase